MDDALDDILKMGKSFDNDQIPEVAEELAATDDIFGGETDATDLAIIGELTEAIAIEDDLLVAIKKNHTDRKIANDIAKEDLYDLIKAAGMDSVKLSCGLSPGTKLTDKFYKAAGTTDEDQQSWLVRNGLGDIIKPTVHFGTFNSTMKTFKASGGKMPEIFNVVPVKGITMRGKSNYLAVRAALAKA
jgi:hypothetical protein